MTTGAGTATVAAVMRPPVTTVELQAHLAAAAYLMKRSGDSALVVVQADGSGVPIGVVTDTDVSQAVADGRDLEQVRVRDVMSGPPVTVAPGTAVADALRTMVGHRMHHLLVVDDGRLAGIVDMLGLCQVSLDGLPGGLPGGGPDGGTG